MRVFERLCLACDLSYRNVEVELDCLTVVRIILGQSTTGANSSLVQHIVQMKLRLTRLGDLLLNEENMLLQGVVAPMGGNLVVHLPMGVGMC
ncbi:hypothetical protein V6N13_147407 [Hibiscus sabdariffa]